MHKISIELFAQNRENISLVLRGDIYNLENFLKDLTLEERLKESQSS